MKLELTLRADYTRQFEKTENAYDKNIAAFIMLDEWKDNLNILAVIAFHYKPQLL